MLPKASLFAPDRACRTVPLLLRTGLVGTQGAVRGALAACLEALHRAGACDDEKMAVEIALAEALNNIVEHAYKGNPSGWVDISLRRSPEETMIELRDAGVPLPGGPPPCAMPVVEGVSGPRDLPEGGFGWGMIRFLTRDVQYQRVGAENILVLRFDHAQGPRVRPYPQSTSPRKM